MNALLDTHTFLWWITDDPRLSASARSIISDSSNRIYVSSATGWEIAIKAQIGKLAVPGEPAQFVAEQIMINSLAILPIRMEHALRIYELPMHHRDPFDRMLVAQSQVENLPLLTTDAAFADYDVRTVW